MPTTLTQAQYDQMEVDLVSLSWGCDENGNETVTGVFTVTSCCSGDDTNLDNRILFSPAAMGSHPDLPSKGDTYSRPSVPALGIDGDGDYCADTGVTGCEPCLDDMLNPIQCTDSSGFPIFIVDETADHPVNDLDRPGLIVKSVKTADSLVEVDPNEDDISDYGKSTICKFRRITVTWGVPDSTGSNNNTPANQSGCNAEDWCPYPVWTEVTESREVTKRPFLGYHTGDELSCCDPTLNLQTPETLLNCDDSIRLGSDACVEPVNSAGCRVVGLSEVYYKGKLCIPIYRNLSANAVDLDYPQNLLGKCNATNLRIDIPCARYSLIVLQKTLKLVSAPYRIVPVYCDGVTYQVLQASLCFEFDRDGHDLQISNSGMYARACPGRPGHKGGDFPDEPEFTEKGHVEGQKTRMADINGQPITRYLDRYGSPLPEGERSVMVYGCCPGNFTDPRVVFGSPLVSITAT